MGDDSKKGLGGVIQIDESQIRGHLDEQLVRGTVEDTLNSLLDAEARQRCSTYKRRKRGYKWGYK